MSKIAADQRLQRVAQLGEAAAADPAPERLRESATDRDHADAVEQCALGRRIDDGVGDQPGELDVVGADRQQDQIELAMRLAALAALRALRATRVDLRVARAQ